jgi:three-Cys-motif partner protein
MRGGLTDSAKLLGGYGPHTAAKHRILRGYLEAWLPIIEKWRGPSAPRETDVVLVDGFAGSGRYDTGQAGSPRVMVAAYLEHESRERMGQWVHLIGIEKQARFVASLREELEPSQFEGTRMAPEIRHGLFAEEFPDVIRGLEESFGRVPPTFAFLDPFGLKDNTLELTSTLAELSGCEVLAYLPTGFMARLQSTPEFTGALDNLYGDRRAWEQAKEIDDLETRRLWLRDRFADALADRCGGSCLCFDIRPQGSNNIYSLVFSSGNRRGIQRMKAVMWEIDPATGQFFQGGLREKQATSLFDRHDESFVPGEPDYGKLEEELRAQYGTGDFTIGEAKDFTLYDTIFRDDAHLKGPVLGELEKRDKLIVVSSPRQRPIPGQYPDGTVLRFRP